MIRLFQLESPKGQGRVEFINPAAIVSMWEQVKDGQSVVHIVTTVGKYVSFESIETCLARLSAIDAIEPYLTNDEKTEIDQFWDDIQEGTLLNNLIVIRMPDSSWRMCSKTFSGGLAGYDIPVPYQNSKKNYFSYNSRFSV